MSNYGLTEDGRFVLKRICEDGMLELDGSITGDGRIIPIYMLFSTDTGVGAEALDSRDIGSADTGVGAEALGSRDIGSADTGAGTDVISELLGVLLDTDVGVGSEELIMLLAELESSDVGVGVEAGEITIWIYLLLKLLQTKEISMKLSHEKLLNMKLSQKQQRG